MREPSSGIHYISDRLRKSSVPVEQIKHTVALFLLALLLVAAETTVLARLPLPFFGWGEAAPALGLLLSMAIGFFYGEREGGVAGLCIGFLSDCTGGGIMLLPLSYFLCGYGTGFAARRRLAHNIPSFAVFSAIGGGLECLTVLIRQLSTTRTLPPPIWMWRGLTPILIWTVIFSPAVYLAVWSVRRLLTPHSNP